MTLQEKLNTLKEYGYEVNEFTGEANYLVQRRCNRKRFEQVLRFNFDIIIRCSIDKILELHRKYLIEIEENYIRCLKLPETF